ncbi:MAG TPA: FtsX-like permease family protein [Candidatus Limnocylindrales bacterium]|nr:FtsX-like permease family protein [Candidatus Limnocylindrales bacterium]
MPILNRKLIRDFLHMKGQALAISLVIAAGIATFVMSLSTLESLKWTQQIYYERYRFAHVFAHLKRAPNSLIERIAEIPGVSRVQTRIVVEVTLDIEGLMEPAVGRLISIPERPTPGLNELYLRKGRYIEPGSRGEVLVSEAFFEAHHFSLSDKVLAILNGRREELKIVGVVLSPEYIFQIRAGDFLPDIKRFGVFWMGYTELAAAFDMEGAFNDVALSLMWGASEPEVIKRLDNLTKPYGGVGAYGRSEQISHRYVTDEIRQLRGMGLVAPVIFLSVAAFLLNVMLSRLISTQREQIAVLKAFGYTRFEIGWHYLKLVGLLVILGVGLGTGIGVWMGRNLTELYTRFYRFPIFEFHLKIGVVLLALLISIAAAVLGTMGALRRAMKLPPAEAMHPEPPAVYRPTLIERSGLQRLFSPGERMILRQLERQPLKTFLSCLGIAMAVAVLVLGSFTEDALDYVLEIEFHASKRQDMTVTFIEPASAPALHEINHLPGVLYSEPFRTVPVRLQFRHHSRHVSIMGLETERGLYRILDKNQHVIFLPPEGLVLSEKLAELLEVPVGETLLVEVLEGERPVREVVVTGLVSDFSGLSAYMTANALHQLLQEGKTLSGAFLAVDDNRIEELYKTLKTIPRIASVTVKKATLESFRETVAENLLLMKVFNILFATILAFGVVYNTVRISLSERSRELATLRVLGFTRREVSVILLGELAVQTFIAMPFGLILGYGFAALATLTLDTEIYRIPLVVSPSTFAFSATVVMIAALVSGLIVRRKLDHLDLIAVLKARE